MERSRQKRQSKQSFMTDTGKRNRALEDDYLLRQAHGEKAGLQGRWKSEEGRILFWTC